MASIQFTTFIFIIWTVLYFFHHNYQAVNSFSGYILFLVIILYIFFLLVILFFTIVNLKWYNLVASIEQRRDEKALHDTLKFQYNQSADMSNKLVNSFKILYFYIEKYGSGLVKEQATEINILNTEYYKYVDLLFINFKSLSVREEKLSDNSTKLIFPDLENYPIHSEELNSFFKSAGNNITTQDIEFMKRLIEFNEKETEGKMSYKHFREIWALMIFFSTQRTENILFYVFKAYLDKGFEFDDNSHIKDVEFSKEQLEDFFATYKDFFPLVQQEFVLKEIQALNVNFTVGELVYVIITFRKYHPH